MNPTAQFPKEGNAQQELVPAEFVSALRCALDESAAGLPESTLNRLSQARQLALRCKKPDTRLQQAAIPVFARVLHSTPGRRRTPWALLFWPVVALTLAAIGFMHWQNQRHIAETADIDAAILSSDLPLNAYLDHGFTAYLSQQH